MKKLFATLLAAAIATAAHHPAQADRDPVTYERGPTRLENTLPPSPEPASAVKYSDVPFTHSFGMAELDIPVYTIAGRELSIPVSLSYRSGGIRLEEVAGVAGLGWSLSAGGCVTRTVVDMPDEFSDTGFSHVMPSGSLLCDLEDQEESNASMSYLRDVLSHNVDSSLDRYSYSVCGLNGTFVILDNQSVFQLSGNGVKIDPTFDQYGAVTSFLITGPDGTKYTLSTKETGTHKGRFQSPTPTTGQPDEWTANTAWYLTSVESASGLDTAQFTYESAATWDRSIWCVADIATITRQGYYQTVNTSISADYLIYRYNTTAVKTITLDGYTVSFTYATDTGRGNHRTESENVLDAQNYPRRLTGISASYAGSPLLSVTVGTSRAACDGRIILDSLRFRHGGNLDDQWDFTYATLNDTVSVFSQDWHGFYNAENEGSAAGTRLRKGPFCMNSATGAITCPWGAPDASSASYMSLVVANHDGAVTEYEYEGRTSATGSSGSPVGVRVKSITVKDNGTVVRKRNFTYGLPAPDGPTSPAQNMYMHVSAKQTAVATHLIPNDTYVWTFSLHGTPVTDGRSIHQTRVAYGSVTEEDTDGTASHGAKTVYTYDTSPVQIFWRETLSRFPSTEWGWLYDSTVYAPANPKPWWGVRDGYIDDAVERPALLTQKEYYAWNGSSYVQKEKEFYTYATPPVRLALVDYKAEQVCEHYYAGVLQYEDIYHYPVWARDYAGHDLTGVQHTWYHDDGSTYDTEAVSYTYTSRGDLSKPARVEKATSSLGDCTRYVSYTYPDTWTGGQPGWISGLIGRHSLDEAVKTEYGNVSYGTGYPWIVTTSEFASFALPGGATALMESRRTESVDGVQSWSEEVLSRDCFGNPSSVKSTGSPETSIIWSYNGLYPVAVLENASWNQVTGYFGGTSGINAITASASLSSTDAGQLNGMRSSLSGAHVSTFEYAPGKGLTKQTTPAGVVTSFERDAAGRLTEVKDGNGDTKESYIYNLLSFNGRRSMRHKKFRNQNGTTATDDVRWWNTLGMVTEDIAIAGAGDGRDLVSAREGDYMLHDDVKIWLPYPVSNTGGLFVSGAAAQSASWHGNSYAYDMKEYDQSGCDHVARTAAPGYAGSHETSFTRESLSSFPLLVWNPPYGVVTQGSWPSMRVHKEVTLDADGRTSSVYKAADGRILAGQSGTADPARYVYDVHGRLSVVIGADVALTDTLNMWRYSYDSHGRLSSRGVPGAVRESYAYDSEDRIVKVKRADGDTDTVYDDFGRVLSVYHTPSGGSAVLVEEHAWDSEPSAATALMVSAGESSSWSGAVTGFETWANLACTDGDTSVDGYVQKAMRYDSFGRLDCVVSLYPDGGILKEKYTYTFPGEVATKVTTYKYGNNTDEFCMNYSYDTRGRVTYVGSELYSSQYGFADDNTDIAYDALGRESSVTSQSYYGLSGTLTTTTDYTLQGLPSEIEAMYDGVTVYDEVLLYGGLAHIGVPASYMGLITGKSETIYVNNQFSRVNLCHYVYDAQGRLSTVKGLLPGDNTYTYDDRGNILSVSLSGGSTSQTYSYSGDRLQSLTSGGNTYQFTYDTMGRMTSDGLAGTGITYNRMGLPAKISGSGGSVLVKYAYLSDGMKSGAFHADGSGFIYRGSLKYARSSTGALTLVGAETPSGMLTPDGPCFSVRDHLGSVVYEVDEMSYGFMDGALYGEWGAREALSGVNPTPVTRRHYTGKEDQWPDFAVPYTDFGARHYSPALRRWLTPDPLSEKYYTSSPYAYCAGDPMNFVDTLGTSIGLPIKMAKAAKKVVKSGKRITSGALLAATVYGYYDDLVTLTSPEATPGEIGLAAFDLMTGFGSEAKLAATHLGIHELAVTNLRSFTFRNFRHNLGYITGGIKEGMQAHHVLPKRHEKEFLSYGINVHDPKYGAWLDPFIHNSTHTSYDARWSVFFNGYKKKGTTPTVEEIEEEARKLMNEYYGNVPLNF